MLFLVSVLCMSSYRGAGQLAGDLYQQKVFIKKILFRNCINWKRRNADDSKDRADAVWGKPVLKEGAVLFLKEGKLYFTGYGKKKNSKNYRLERGGFIH